MSRYRQSIFSVAAACLLFTSSSVARAETYALEMSHTSIIFGISHMGYSYTYGRFNSAKGNFSWDNANPAAGNFVVAIDAASIDSNDPKRDEHLRNADFFNVKQFPQIVFQSTSIKPSQEGENMYDVTGNFTMHGVTKPVTLPMKKLGEGKGPYGKFRCGFFCQTTIKRSDFGMTNMLPSGDKANIGDEVAITISFEGVRDGAAGPASAAAAGSATQPTSVGAPAAAGSSGTR